MSRRTDPRTATHDLAVRKLASSGLGPDDLEWSVAEAAEMGPLGFQPYPALKIHYLDPRTGGPMTHRPKWPQFVRYRFLVDVPHAQGTKAPRYVQPARSGVCAYFPPRFDWKPVLSDPTKEIFITEGELKAAKACKEGLACIGLGGVCNFVSSDTGFLPELESINWVQRMVTIVFDHDEKPNPNVLSAANRLAAELYQCGAVVFYLRLPAGVDGAKMGLDDYLIAHSRDEFDVLLKGRESMTLAKRLWELNDRFVKVRSPLTVVDLSDLALLDVKEFHSHYANQQVPEQVLNKAGEMSRKPVNAADKWLQWPLRSSADSLDYAPGQERYTEAGNINLWPGWGCEPVEGDVEPFKKLLLTMFPVKADREWILRWLAYPIQHPGAKLYTAVVMWSAVQGTGKTLLGATMGRVYGANYAVVGREELASSFNSWSRNKQFILGEEITGSDSHDFPDKLKAYVTGEEIRINEKFIKGFTLPNRMNFLFASNHANAFLLDAADRRYSVHELSEKLDVEWATNVYDPYYKSHEGASAIYWYLKHKVDTSSFNPRAPAPMTEAKQAMIAMGLSRHAAWAKELIEDPGLILSMPRADGSRTQLARELWTLKELQDVFARDGSGKTSVGTQVFAQALRQAGALEMKQQPLWKQQRRRWWAVCNIEYWRTHDNASSIKSHLDKAWVTR